MSNVGHILWISAFTIVAPLINSRPRNSRQPGTLTACESRRSLFRLHGTLSSPNFPDPYPANSSCTWIITPPQHVNLSVRFVKFNVSSDSNHCGGKKCRCDFVHVKELDSPQNVAGFNGRFCNDNPPRSVYNLMSRVKIRFVSDSAKEGMGFELRYQTLESPSTVSVAFDFTQVPSQAKGGVTLPVNQKVTATTLAASNFTDTPVQSMTSSNINSSGVGKPLSAFTNTVPDNLIVTTNTVGSIELPRATIFPKSFPVTEPRTHGRDWTGTTHVVMAVEKKKIEEKVPDIIILGPSVPVVMIFVLVVAGIAWWNYKFDLDELNRYESYTRSSKVKNRYKKSMKNLSKGVLYSEMAKNWKGGQSFSMGSGYRGSPMVGKKTSFAGRFLEIAEGVITPRTSRPPSGELAPLTKSTPESPTSLYPGSANAGGGSRPSSRPASILLRDALVSMFGGSGESSSENRESGSPSKRASKRVSFVDESGQPLVQSEASPSEGIEEKLDELDKATDEECPQPVKPWPLQIPAIVVRQPSEDCEDETESPIRRKDPMHEFDDSELISSEDSPDVESSLPVFDENEENVLGHFDEDDRRRIPSWDDHEGSYPDSSSEEILDRSLIFPDLEDFLLNLDKDSVDDEPPYSCESHIRDILRKSYGDEALSSLGPSAVLSIPEEFLGMIRDSPRSNDRAKEDRDYVDDVD